MDLSYYRNEIMKQTQAINDHIHELLEPIAKEEGLTLSQLFVLANIQCPHMQTIGSLAKELRIDRSNTSTLCKKMEKDGLLVRKRSLDDERIVQLSLSDRGNEIVKRVKVKMNLIDQSLLNIDEERLQTVLKGYQEAEHIFQYLIEKHNS